MAKYPKAIRTKIYKHISDGMTGQPDIRVELGDRPYYDTARNLIVNAKAVWFAKDEEEDYQFGRGLMIHEVAHVLFCSRLELIDARLADAGVELNDHEKDMFYSMVNIAEDHNNEYRASVLFPHLTGHLQRMRIASQEHDLAKNEEDIVNNPVSQVHLQSSKLVPWTKPLPKLDPDYDKWVNTWVTQWNDMKMYGRRTITVVDWVIMRFEEWRKVCEKREEDVQQYQNVLRNLQNDLAKAIKSKDQTKIDAAKKAQQKAMENKPKRPPRFGTIAMARQPTLKHVKQESAPENTTFSPPPDYSNLTLEQLKDMLRQRQEQEQESSKVATGWGNSSLEDGEVTTVTVNEQFDDPIKLLDQDKAYKDGKEVHRVLKKRIKLEEASETRQRSGRVDVDECRTQVSKNGRLVNNRVFRRQNTYQKGGEWAVEILIDCSGSMSGDKMAQAKQAFATLGYALDGLPNVRYALTGFTSGGGSKATEVLVKTFRERKLNIEAIELLDATGGNADGLNIRAATDRLVRLGNFKKVLIVISDGQPAYHRGSVDGITDTAKAVREAKDRRVRVIGIGIEGANPKSMPEMYPDHNYLFTDTSTLAEDLTKLVLSSLGQLPKARVMRSKWEM
jgi:Mg-chelatase subunit ChlD